MSSGIDSLGMLEATLRLPDQIAASAAAVEGVRSLPVSDDIANVVVLGMGGSGIAGDVLTAVAAPFMPIPLVVAKTYGAPKFIGRDTLVLAVSVSGTTEETLEATGQAIDAGARVIAVTRGGDLGTMVDGAGGVVIAVDPQIPAPRAALGAVSVPPMLVLEKVGLFPGAAGWVGCAVDQLRRRADELGQQGNEAERMAVRLERTVPVIYGGGDLGPVAAARWKTQINENAKVPAFSAAMPELCHNEIVGWGALPDLTSSIVSMVNLRHEFEHPQIERRFELVGELVGDAVTRIEQVVAEGLGSVAQLFDLILFGDVVSYHLAVQAGIDPGPVEVIDGLKSALAPQS